MAKRYSKSTKAHDTVPFCSGEWQRYHETKIKDHKTGRTGRGTGNTSKQSKSRAWKNLWK